MTHPENTNVLTPNPVPKMDAIELIREKTKQDVLNKLNKYGKCFLIRPTGYGKTYLMAELITLYKKVLYLYPNKNVLNAIKSKFILENDLTPKEQVEIMLEKSRSFGNVDAMTYQKFCRMDMQDIIDQNYDLILLDEGHKVGGLRTAEALQQLMRDLPTAHFLGATATPNRTDSFDFVTIFFSGITAFEYTIHQAIKDGLLLKPNYCFCTYDIEETYKQSALLAGQNLQDPIVQDVIKKHAIETAKIYNMENIIKEMIVGKQLVHDTSYMKFIVFFPTIEAMNKKVKIVKRWFRQAMPEHSVHTLKISTKNKKEHDNVHKLNRLKHREKGIDLICCVDMLNLGTHINDLTGIVMYRATSSSIIFNQQLGRCLSSGAEHPAIVFDVVDNLHRRAAYELLEEPDTEELLRLKKKAEQKENYNNGKTKNAKNDTGLRIDDNGNVVNKNGIKTHLTMDEEGQIIDEHGNVTKMWVDPGTNIVFKSNNEHTDNNVLDANDVNIISLTANGHIATDDELLAKMEAEVISQRCRLALIAHFRCWCRDNNKDYKKIRTLHEILNTDPDYRKSKGAEEFIKDFITQVKNAKINYPVHDLQKLIEYGEDNDDNLIPLRICAYSVNTSVNAVINYIKSAF